MFSLSIARRMGDFRSTKLTDEFSAVMNRQGWTFDHVAIDVGNLTGAAGRVTRDLLGQERDTECVKFVHKQIFNTILRRMNAKKSIALFFDGSEPAWKLRRSRKYPGKKSEGKFYRSCASPMVYTLEDKLRTAIPEMMKQSPLEFLVSGAATPGPVESKLSAWMFDLACRQDVTRNDTIALVGGTDLFLSGLAATPFHNVTTVTLNQGEVQSLSLQESLEWLCLDHLLKDAGTSAELRKRLSSIRTDVVFLHLLSNGISATDMLAAGISFRDLLDAYLITISPSSSNPAPFLFGEDPADGNRLQLDTAALEKLLMKATKRATSFTKQCSLSADYLEIALQSHAMLCCGGIKNFEFVPSEPLAEKLAPVNLQNLMAHLKYLSSPGKAATPAPNPKISATVNSSWALTAAESLFISSTNVSLVEQILPAFAGGHGVPQDVAADIVGTEDIFEALSKVREVLAPVLDVGATHRAMIHMPSHYFCKKAGAKGPPFGWEYKSVNVGVMQDVTKVRSASYAAPSVEGAADDGGMILAKSQAATKNTLIAFTLIAPDSELGNDAAGAIPAAATELSEEGAAAAAANSSTSIVGEWGEVPCETDNSTKEFPSMLKFLSYNVQFSRHSGERTPLGKPGVDWCSSTRYIALSYEMSQTDADVIGMQEVEPAWQHFLSQQDWVKKNYRFSCGPKGEAINPWGVLLLIHNRVRVSTVSNANVPGYSGHTSVMPTVAIELAAGIPLTISCCHLLAPYTDTAINNRVTQLDNLTKRLSPKLVGTDSIVMGDFNDYPENFYYMPSDMAYKDGWLSLHPDQGMRGADESGYTINGKLNPYADLIIEKQYFGRADRILFKSKHLQPIESGLVGTRSVKRMVDSGDITLPKELSCPEYLYPSDHFGVWVEMQIV